MWLCHKHSKLSSSSYKAIVCLPTIALRYVAFSVLKWRRNCCGYRYKVVFPLFYETILVSLPTMHIDNKNKRYESKKAFQFCLNLTKLTGDTFNLKGIKLKINNLHLAAVLKYLYLLIINSFRERVGWWGGEQSFWRPHFIANHFVKSAEMIFDEIII